MNIGKACAIFQQIHSDKYTPAEKAEAIRDVLGMPTHMGTTKDSMLAVIGYQAAMIERQTETKLGDLNIQCATCPIIEYCNGYYEAGHEEEFETVPPCRQPQFQELTVKTFVDVCNYMIFEMYHEPPIEDREPGGVA